jgi:uncharacterized membrane protein YdjX (TVP38/TMEM64 family)
MIGPIVYVLCALTSGLCAFLLARGYARSRVRLLFWSALCFAGFAVNNVWVVVDLVFVPSVDFSLWRKLPTLLGLGALLYGFIWESE